MPKNAAPSTELDTYKSEILAKVSDAEVVDPAEMAMAIVRRVFTTDDPDAILDLGEQAAVSGEDIADIPFIVRDVSWHKAAAQYEENSLGVFVVLTVEMKDSGETNVVTCGGSNVVAQVYKLEKSMGPAYENEEWAKRPMRFRTVQTARGFTTLWLARAS